ncbi:putative C2H2 finger domain protein (Ezf) [Aspergillus clavatus NRRL 1]|uniref:C2H2 finger domain protein (Ezf), putative n=1 Tax=Aspergillus clavatus (strain ATCC 1007 / CBS 513.65 / DSM 816 / NCTC 3887 / NRRL 1 / QM 1276 / 107) TaxID=344612 RepID=A1CU01_ASPCL|nr:C2H2 finger domain protein (Ezf), putative [Aspergillus clavatus NRRL 1]EAW06788.1 C2H2 finger domain protein (Ezf), putative [Aspergillus clavatus NRRL 1]
MNWIPQPPVSVYVPSTSEDDVLMIEPAPCYVPEVQAHASYPSSTQPDIGLGITYNGMETQFSQLGFCSGPESVPLSTADWSDQLMPSVFNPSLEVNTLSAGPCYDSFGAPHDVSASPLSLYSPQTLSASPSYCSTLDMGNQDKMGCQPSHMWPSTPCSDTATFLEGWCEVKEEPEDCADPLLFADSSIVTGLQMSTSIPQLMVSNASSGLASSDAEGLDPLMNSDHTVKGCVQYDQEAVSPRNEDHMVPVNDKPSPKLPSASGLVCTLCGMRFTRRSNCREHIKRHDPSSRKQHPCDVCGKSFGRRTDLKRHVDSIHHGLRNFGCDQCERRFSRQDTLSRHKADGCRRKPRKSNPKSKETTELAQPVPSPSPNLHSYSEQTTRKRGSNNERF